MTGDFNYHFNRAVMGGGERKQDRKFMERMNDTCLQQKVKEITWEENE